MACRRGDLLDSTHWRSVGLVDQDDVRRTKVRFTRMVPELVPGTMRVGQRGDANHANLRVGSEARVEVVKIPPGGAQDENPAFGSSRVGHAAASVVRMVDAQQPHIHMSRVRSATACSLMPESSGTTKRTTRWTSFARCSRRSGISSSRKSSTPAVRSRRSGFFPAQIGKTATIHGCSGRSSPEGTVS